MLKVKNILDKYGRGDYSGILDYAGHSKPYNKFK